MSEEKSLVISESIVNDLIPNTTDYVTIASTGNAADFGDLTQARTHCGSASGD